MQAIAPLKSLWRPSNSVPRLNTKARLLTTCVRSKPSAGSFSLHKPATSRICSRLYATERYDKAAAKTSFHRSVRETQDAVPEELEEPQLEEASGEQMSSPEFKAKTIKLKWNGPEYEVIGRNELDQLILRPVGMDASTQYKLVEHIRKSQGSRKSRAYQTVIVQEPLRDQDFDKLVPLDPHLDSPFDFSHLFAKSDDLPLLFEALSTKTKLSFNKNRDAAVQAFECVVKGQNVKPMEVSCHTIGKELIELHVLHAITSNYPHLPPQAIIKFTERATSGPSLSRSLLDLGLEPHVQLVPKISLSKFPDPSATCLEIAAIVYASLIGLIYQEHGFTAASEFLFSTLDLGKINAEELRRMDLLDGVTDAKKTLNDVLYRLRFPLPTYEMEHVNNYSTGAPAGHMGNKFIAIVKSGSNLIGRGKANSKMLAEQRAAADALLAHWATESPSL